MLLYNFVLLFNKRQFLVMLNLLRQTVCVYVTSDYSLTLANLSNDDNYNFQGNLA